MREQFKDAARKSNEVLAKLAPGIQWNYSFEAQNKTLCVYLADNEALIREHAERSGFPATVVTEVKHIIDPTTESA